MKRKLKAMHCELKKILSFTILAHLSESFHSVNLPNNRQQEVELYAIGEAMHLKQRVTYEAQCSCQCQVRSMQMPFHIYEKVQLNERLNCYSESAIKFFFDLGAYFWRKRVW